MCAVRFALCKIGCIWSGIELTVTQDAYVLAASDHFHSLTAFYSEYAVHRAYSRMHIIDKSVPAMSALLVLTSLATTAAVAC